MAPKMLKPSKALTALLSCLCALISMISSAYAGSSEIVIVDIANAEHARFTVDRPTAIQFTINDVSGNPADGFEVFLTNTETHQSFAKTVKDGKVVFEDVGPGNWQVTSALDSAQFTAIQIISGSAALAVDNGAAIALGAVALSAGGAAAAIAINDSGNDSNPLSPSF